MESKKEPTTSLQPLKSIVIANNDEPDFVSNLKDLLEHLGYQVLGLAKNGVEAVEQVRQTHANILLLDIYPPAMNGMDVLRQVAELGGTAVVILTADKDPQSAREALDLGASGYILKPLKRDQMTAILESAWHRFQTTAEVRGTDREVPSSDDQVLRKVFHYICINLKGEFYQGESVAIRQSDLVIRLEESGYFLVWWSEETAEPGAKSQIVEPIPIASEVAQKIMGRVQAWVNPIAPLPEEVAPIREVQADRESVAEEGFFARPSRAYHWAVAAPQAYFIVVFCLLGILWFNFPHSDRRDWAGTPQQESIRKKIQQIHSGMKRSQVEQWLQHPVKVPDKLKGVTRYFEPPDTYIDVAYDKSGASKDDTVRGEASIVKVLPINQI